MTKSEKLAHEEKCERFRASIRLLCERSTVGEVAYRNKRGGLTPGFRLKTWYRGSEWSPLAYEEMTGEDIDWLLGLAWESWKPKSPLTLLAEASDEKEQSESA